MAKSTYVWLDQLSRAYGRRHPDARRDPGRGARHARAAGASPGCGSSACGSARRRPSGSSGCAATPTPSRRRTRSTTTGSPTTSAARRPTRPCATGRGRAASAWPATWSPTTWASIRAGSSSTRSGSSRSPQPPYPAYTFDGPDLSTDERVGIVLEDHYWNDSDAAVVFKRFDRWTGDDALRLPRQRRHELPVERHRPAGLPEGRASASRSSGRSSTSRGASRSSASMRRWSSPSKHVQRLWWPEPGQPGGIPSRAEHALTKAEFDAPDAGRVLARGRGPGRRRGARHAAPRRGVLDARGLLRPDARDAPRLQQRVHAHAPRRGRGGLPAGHQATRSSSTRRSSSATSTS